MSSSENKGRGPLWASTRDVDEQTLPWWRALIIALGVEIIVPFLVFGVDWSFLPSFEEPPPVEVMSVRLEEPPPQLQQMPPPPKEKKPEEQKKSEPKPKKEIKNITPIEPPKPFPNEVPSEIEIPKPKPKPKPKPVKKEEPELPPLPSVFRDVKPVHKVKPKYPREAEDQHIEGRVKVRLTVELDGSVSAVKILLSEPPGVFEEEVLKAVKQYQFKRDGTTYEADQLIIFKLDP
ncbi:MAG: energy transducer TonB [Burkholderiales bacterium]|jgi:protein TonB